MTRSCYMCGGPPSWPGTSKCRKCHARYTSEWRKRPENIAREAARREARQAKKRGSIVQVSCERCGSCDSQMHHPDYGKPTTVVWLCRQCHVDWHTFSRLSTNLAWSLWLKSFENTPTTPSGQGVPVTV